MSALRLDLTIATYPGANLGTPRAVDAAGDQLPAAGLVDVRRALSGFKGAGDVAPCAWRWPDPVPIRVLDARGA